MGAVVVLAHPFLNLNEAELRTFLEQARCAGLDAMETLYSTYDEQTSLLSRKIAQEYGLLESGGSDFHRQNKPDVEVGLAEELKTMVEIPKADDNQLQTAIDVLLEGEEVVKARLEAEKALETTSKMLKKN